MSATPVLDTAVAYWRACDYVAGADYIIDGSGNAHNARLGSAEGADTNDPLYLEPDGYTSYANPGTQYLYLPGTSGNYASTPDANHLDVTGDIDIRWEGALDDWTGVTSGALVSKWGASGQRSYLFYLSSGKMRLGVSANGSDGIYGAQADSVVDTLVGDGEKVQLRVTRVSSSGLISYYYKTTGQLEDSSGWTANGTDTQASGAIFNSNNAVEVGTSKGGTDTLAGPGKHYRAIVKNGIDGTTVFDADFTNRSNVVEPFATFTEDSANAATVTINRSATGAKSTVVDYPLFLLHTDDYFEIADHADLNFAADESLTALWLGRRYGTTADLVLLAKKDDLSTAAGYSLDTGTAGAFSALIADGTAAPEDIGAALSAGVRAGAALVRDVGADTVTAFKDGVSSGSPTTDNTTATLANALPLRIGATSGVAASFGEYEFFAAAIFRSALSADDLATAADELIGLVASGGVNGRGRPGMNMGMMMGM